MRKTGYFIGILAVLALIMIIAGCDGDDPPPPPTPSCAEQGGEICNSGEEECRGEFIKAKEAECCRGECVMFTEGDSNEICAEQGGEVCSIEEGCYSGYIIQSIEEGCCFMGNCCERIIVGNINLMSDNNSINVDVEQLQGLTEQMRVWYGEKVGEFERISFVDASLVGTNIYSVVIEEIKYKFKVLIPDPNVCKIEVIAEELPTTSCTDSDGGKDYYVKGTTQDSTTTKTDNCWDDNITISEYYCVNDVAEQINYNCSNGCKDGACIAEVSLTEKCTPIFENGPTNTKINIYFYEDGFNSKPQVYDDYIKNVTAVTFGGYFGGENFLGIEPFKSLKQEFNVFSYKDLTNNDDGNCWPTSNECNYANRIIPELTQNCTGFAAPSDWGALDGNYNIIVVPFDEEGWGSSSRSIERLDQTTIRIASSDVIYHNINLGGIASLVHEFGHKIGFFDEEYFYYGPYLEAQTFYPNIDSFSCTKWCQGVNKQSECYNKYAQWLECFKNKFIDASPEIREVLERNNLDYTTQDYSWWGTCFSGRNINLCGGQIAAIVKNGIEMQDTQWVSNWEYCKNLYSDLAGSGGCDLGLNCGENGCYVGGSFSRFLPSRENEFLMGSQYEPTDRFNKLDENILRNNILNKIRYIDVENIEK